MKKYMIIACLIFNFAYSNNLDKSYSTPIVAGKNQNTINITLPENPTTGYLWFLSKFNNSLIKLQGYEYKRDNNMIGGGGVAVFKIKLRKTFKIVPQKQVLVFEELRPWDSKSKPLIKKVTILSLPS